MKYATCRTQSSVPLRYLAEVIGILAFTLCLPGCASKSRFLRQGQTDLPLSEFKGWFQAANGGLDSVPPGPLVFPTNASLWISADDSIQAGWKPYSTSVSCQKPGMQNSQPQIVDMCMDACKAFSSNLYCQALDCGDHKVFLVGGGSGGVTNVTVPNSTSNDVFVGDASAFNVWLTRAPCAEDAQMRSRKICTSQIAEAERVDPWFNGCGWQFPQVPLDQDNNGRNASGDFLLNLFASRRPDFSLPPQSDTSVDTQGDTSATLNVHIVGEGPKRDGNLVHFTLLCDPQTNTRAGCGHSESLWTAPSASPEFFSARLRVAEVRVFTDPAGNNPHSFCSVFLGGTILGIDLQTRAQTESIINCNDDQSGACKTVQGHFTPATTPGWVIGFNQDPTSGCSIPTDTRDIFVEFTLAKQ
jgi:hypothetical protein